MEKTSKVLFIRIAVIHLVLLIFLSFFTNISFSVPKKLCIREIQPVIVTKTQPKTIEPSKRAPIKKSFPSKKVETHHPSSRISPSLLQKLQEETAALSKSQSKKKEELLVPQKIETMEIDHPLSMINISKEEDLRDLFVRDLKKNLKLPEFGEVKVLLNLSEKGEIVNLSILSSMSRINEEYLKKTLPTLSFPWLHQFSSFEKNIVIIFTNEEF